MTLCLHLCSRKLLLCPLSSPGPLLASFSVLHSGFRHLCLHGGLLQVHLCQHTLQEHQTTFATSRTAIPSTLAVWPWRGKLKYLEGSHLLLLHLQLLLKILQ